MHIPLCQGHEVYLGLLTFSIKSKRLQFGYLRDCVAKKLDSWKNKCFSEGGREVLIKTIIQATPTYAMSCFRIPNTINGEIERMTANFWWGDKAEKPKIHWKAWQNLLLPKKEGGMGFRDLTLFNKALQAKKVWRIMENPNSLVSKVFKARYFKHMDIMEAGTGTNPSYIWRSLMWSKEIL